MHVLKFFLRLIMSAIVIAVVIVVTQDLQIFPTAVFSILNSSERDSATLPKGVESIFVKTKDSEQLELWRFQHPAAHPKSKKVAILFHGNAGDVANFFPYQFKLGFLGMIAYGFDYRGYGKSSGWPTEKGLYADARAVANYVMERENVGAKDLVLVGVSIGSAPASHLAKELNVGCLVLAAPFSSLPDVVKTNLLFGVLAPFLFYDFPVREHVSALQSTCVVVAHGKADNVVPYEQGRLVFEGRASQRQGEFISLGSAGHNDIFFSAWVDIAQAIEVCIDGIGESVRH